MTRRMFGYALLFGFVSAAGTAVAGRFADYTAKYKNPEKPVSVERASYLGGAGTEWLVGGGFLPDGTVVLVGNSLGPDLQLVGAPAATVVGRDGAPPGALKAIPAWNQGKAAPFIAWLNPADGTVKAVARWPWQSGTVTDARTDAGGALYVAGVAGTNLNSVAAVKDVSAEPVAGALAFVARLSGTTGKPLWICTFAYPMKGVMLRFDKTGNLNAEAGWVYVFRPDGTLDRAAKIRKVKDWARGVNPVDQSFVLGGDHNTSTGREPWRQPFLEIYDKDGQKKFDYYRWDPKLVGTDKYRLVSDSDFRYFHFDDSGMLYAVGWSDGGNTVFERQPTSLDKPVAASGLGFSTWGANAGSFAHIMKIDTVAGETRNKTVWCGFLKGKEKPSGAGIEHLRVATDGSVVLAGGSAFGLIQTGDALHPFPDDPGGPYVAVLDRELSSIRFSSTIVAAGKVPIREGEKWNTASAVVNGRHKLLFVSGAIAKEGCYAEPRPAPTRNGVQETSAGGLADGYFILMDLGPAVP